MSEPRKSRARDIAVVAAYELQEALRIDARSIAYARHIARRRRIVAEEHGADELVACTGGEHDFRQMRRERDDTRRRRGEAHDRPTVVRVFDERGSRRRKGKRGATQREGKRCRIPRHGKKRGRGYAPPSR